MSDFFNGKIVIITGASSGIGKALAYRLSELGAIAVIASRSAEKLKIVAEDLKSAGRKVLAITADVSKEEECSRLVETTVQTFGGIDILINNAGISMKALFSEVDLTVLKRLMDVNFWGTVYCSKYALPYLIERKGSLVGVSSVAGYQGLPGRSGYSASKFAMHGLLESIRIENRKKKLHVMIFAPAFTASEIRKHALLADGKEQGESPRREEKLDSPEYVATQIIKGIRNRRRNQILSVEGKLTVLLKRLMPGLVDWGYYREFAKEPNSILK
ncbi:MAG TPA: SDR family oxidoreductase [Bacteroidales bacterium]|nr:SDR family oxidoreductase [Bacteroidales bacterium]HQG56916.1 SDR family oxidoreductase [Bacteroidales bacterium]